MVEQNVTSQQADVRLFPWWLVLLWGIFAVIIGALFLAYPLNSLMASIVFLGVYWFIGGIFTLFAAFMEPTDRGWKILIAIISILAGLAILAYPLYSFLVLPAFFIIFVGFWALFVGAVKIYQGFAGKDWGAVILGVISIIFGFLLLGSPYVAVCSSSLHLRGICAGWWNCSHCCLLHDTGRTEGIIKPVNSFFS